jgi:hypothetical protein
LDAACRATVPAASGSQAARARTALLLGSLVTWVAEVKLVELDVVVHRLLTERGMAAGSQKATVASSGA